MDKDFDVSKLNHEDLLEIYKQLQGYIAFLEKEKSKVTEEK